MWVGLYFVLFRARLGKHVGLPLLFRFRFFVFSGRDMFAWWFLIEMQHTYWAAWLYGIGGKMAFLCNSNKNGVLLGWQQARGVVVSQYT